MADKLSNSLSDAIANNSAKYLGESGILNTSGTFQIPNFANYNSFIISARRWGTMGTVFITKWQIANALTGGIWLFGTGSDTAKTKISVSTSGLITIESTSNEVFVNVYGINLLTPQT